MQNNLIKSIRYLEGVNKLDDLINELLYSEQSGYINTISSDAVNNAQNVIEKFNYEADKIMREYEISQDDEVLKEKQTELKLSVKKHYDKELINWAQEVFRNICDNIIFSVSINKDNKNLLSKLYNRLQNAVIWVSDICNLNDSYKSEIFSKLKNRFMNALNSKDDDFIEKPTPQNSDSDLFMELRNLIVADSQKFLRINFYEYKNKLTTKDINYLLKCSNKLRINKTDILDEQNLINCAIDMLHLKDNKDKYNFICQIDDEFIILKPETISDKAKIVKNRLELFKDKMNYFKKLLVL